MRLKLDCAPFSAWVCHLPKTPLPKWSLNRTGICNTSFPTLHCTISGWRSQRTDNTSSVSSSGSLLSCRDTNPLYFLPSFSFPLLTTLEISFHLSHFLYFSISVSFSFYPLPLYISNFLCLFFFSHSFPCSSLLSPNVCFSPLPLQPTLHRRVYRGGSPLDVRSKLIIFHFHIWVRESPYLRNPGPNTIFLSILLRPSLSLQFCISTLHPFVVSSSFDILSSISVTLH